MTKIRGSLIEFLASIPGSGPVIAGTNDKIYAVEILKDQIRVVRERMDHVIEGIEEGLGRKRVKGEALAGKIDVTASATDRILDAVRNADDYEGLTGFLEREFVGL